jgi:hypothetical protein
MVSVPMPVKAQLHMVSVPLQFLPLHVGSLRKCPRSGWVTAIDQSPAIRCGAVATVHGVCSNAGRSSAAHGVCSIAVLATPCGFSPFWGDAVL